METAETILRIAVVDKEGKVICLDLSESVARAVREKLNAIFGPDERIIREYFSPVPVQPITTPAIPGWPYPQTICGNLT